MQNTQLLIVDVQERLLPHIFNARQVVEQTARMARAAREMCIPVTVSEQYVRGLGPTEAALREAAGDARYVEKMTFSVWRDEAARRALAALGRPVVLLTGIETHVCVQQTALDLAENGFSSVLLMDAAGARRETEHSAAIRRMERGGVDVSTVEAVIYALLERAGTDLFRKILPIVK